MPALAPHADAIADADRLAVGLLILRCAGRIRSQDLPSALERVRETLVIRARPRSSLSGTGNRDATSARGGEDRVEQQAEGRVRLAPVLDGKTKQDNAASANRGFHDRGPPSDRLLAFEPAAEKNIFGGVPRYGLEPRRHRRIA